LRDPFGMESKPRGGRKVDAPFEVDDDWVSSLPFERAPRRIVHLPLECVVYVPSTQGDDSIDAEEFERRRSETAAMLVGLLADAVRRSGPAGTGVARARSWPRRSPC
jgi:hypothetical protein